MIDFKDMAILKVPHSKQMTMIRQLVKDGLTHKEIASEINVSPTTLTRWKREIEEVNIAFAEGRRAKILENAEKNLEEFTDSAQNDDPRLRFDATKHVTETLGKRHYSKNEGINITINNPQPIIDLGPVVATIPPPINP